jgi:hypothetical protein
MKTITTTIQSMKPKSLLSLACTLVLLCLGGQANAALTVINGDFSNLTGLTYVGGPWYSGVPFGWNTDFTNTIYTVKYTGITNGAYDYVANLSQLTSTSPNFYALSQSVGTTDYTGDVTVKFDLANINGGGYDVGVAIFQGPNSNTLLANRSIQDVFPDANGVPQNGVGTFELTALNVASGSLLQIAFWTTGGTPSLDNVQVSIIPEPTTLDLISLPVKVGLYMVDTISKNIYTCGINPRKFNALTIVY